MGKLILGLILALPLISAAGQIYRYVDDNGDVHYTDQAPSRDAKPIEVKKPSTFRFEPIPAQQAPTASAESEIPQLSLVSPTNGETFRDTNPLVNVVAAVSPRLGEGQGLLFFHNGKALNAKPSGATSIIATEVFRGEHTFSVQLVDASGRNLASAGPVTVYKHPPIKR